MIEDWKQSEHQVKMERWAIKYPFCAYIMCSNDTTEEKLKHTQELYEKL